MPTFYENRYVQVDKNLKLSENLEVNDFMCGHCRRLKMSNDLIDALTLLKKEYPDPFYVVKGYLCEEWCMENGKKTNRSHTQGTAVDIHYGAKVPLLDILDVVVKIFPYVGVTRATTGEYYLHLQVADNHLYWLCAKKENAPAEYVYYKDINKFRSFIESHDKIFGKVKI